MSVSALYILDSVGKPLISRNYRAVQELDIENFMTTMMDMEEDKALTPVFTVSDTTFAFTKHKTVYFVAILNQNTNIELVFVFLNKIIEVMNDYFREVEEESIKDNFVLIHELLDEVMDFGYPQITDSSILKEYITQESKWFRLERKVPATVTNAVSWRSEGIVYNSNELFLDVIESIDIVANRNGCVVTSEINGSVILRVQLSGMPQLQLGLNDRLQHKKSGKDVDNCVDLDDVKFHQCVRLSRFENDRVISFVPPDAVFELMSYRITTYVKPPIWVHCVAEIYPKYKIDYCVKATSHFKTSFIAHDVDIVIPVVSDVDSPVLKASSGTVSYAPEKNALRWVLKTFHGCKEVSMNASFRLPSVESEEKERLGPINVEFEIPFLALSGLKVQHLKILEKSAYKSKTWVRYTTRTGNYQIRTKEILHSKK